MKKLLFTALMMFCLSANAEHHREHATENLENALQIAGGMKYLIGVMRNTYIRPLGLTDEQDAIVRSNMNAMYDQAQNIVSETEYVIMVVNDDTLDMLIVLPQARRLLNKPWKVDDPQSILYRYGVISHYLHRIMPLYYSGSIMVAIIGHQKSAWEYTDFALWHINDAIIEELYTPEAFK